jgi:phage gp29-like protein
MTKLRHEQRAADETAAAAHRMDHRAGLLAEHMQQAAGRAQKKDTAHSIELFASVEELRVHLVAKTGKGARMKLVYRQFDARVTGRATLFVYFQAAIGARYRVAA